MRNLIFAVMRPLHGGALWVIIIFAIFFGLCSNSLFGLPLECILISWFAKYTFVLFDHFLRGFNEPPALDINMMRPWGELRPFGMLIIVGGMSALTWTAYTYAGFASGVVLACIWLIFLPASVAVLGLESSLLKAILPRTWLRMVRELGVYYWATLALIAAEFITIYLLGKLPLGLMLQCAVAMFGILSAFSLLAGALYERREQIGFIAWASPERREEKLRREEHRHDENTITDAYGLLRANRHGECWAALQAWLDSQKFSSDAYRWLIQRADSWEDPRYGKRLAEDWVEGLLSRKQAGQALVAVAERLRRDPDFRPRSAADTLNLAQLAIQGGGSPRTARLLLADFGERFPEDVRCARAAQLAEQLR